jgi:hypothetical protein
MCSGRVSSSTTLSEHISSPVELLTIPDHISSPVELLTLPELISSPVEKIYLPETSGDKSCMRKEPDYDYDKQNISVVICHTDTP